MSTGENAGMPSVPSGGTRLRTRLGDRARTVAEWFQDQWFDRTRRVHTRGNVSLLSAGIASGEQRDSELYQPARPAHVREALRLAIQTLPAQDVSAYTYIDIGSGKGRTLFVAAEWPFLRIVGVEFSGDLHRQAHANIATYRRRRQRRVESLHCNATEFIFPETPMLIYMFNPFGAATMRQVLAHLDESLQRTPRHTIVVLLWPRAGDMVARVHGMRLTHQSRYIQIFANDAQSV